MIARNYVNSLADKIKQKLELTNFASVFKYFLIGIALLNNFQLHAQNNFNVTVKSSTFLATNNHLPFWFVANQHGKVSVSNSFLNVTDVKIEQTIGNGKESAFTWYWGGDIIAAFGETNYFQVNQAFTGITLKGWELKGGMFYNPIRYADLSTTNGNIACSGNARPYPMIRFSSVYYKPVPFMENWLSFKAVYDEGLLNDNRFVENAHLHHKSVYFLIQPKLTWKIHLGFEHFAMWGGKSKDESIGQIPSDFNAYWRYVFGVSGNEDFPEADQLNVAGNQLGTYQLEIVKYYPEFNISFFLSHPFENWTGRNWRNWKDNLLGIHFSLKNKKNLITDIVYEFTNTRQQGITDSLYIWNEKTEKWDLQLIDNYFTHGIYKSGFTYHHQIMGSPLFFPVLLEEDGSPIGLHAISSTRFFSHHIGIKGYFSEFIQYKGLLTLIHHFGAHAEPYEISQKQLSGLFEARYINPKFPVELGISTSADAGKNIKNILGVQFWIAKRW